MSSSVYSRELEHIIDDMLFVPSLSKKHRTANKVPTGVQLTRLIAKGMNGQYLEKLQQHIPINILASTLDISPRNLSKLYKGKLSKQQTDRLYSLILTWADLRHFFQNDDELLNEWLSSSNPLYSGDAPSKFISTVAGRNVLTSSLNAMRYGEFV